MAKTCGIASLLILTASAIAHFATFIPSVSVSMTLVWPLHLATMVVFAAMVIILIGQQQRLPERPAKGPIARWRAAREQSSEFQSQLSEYVPRGVRIAVVAAFLYAMINIVLFMTRMEGVPAEENGNYYLHNHGKKVRDITQEEYQQFRAYEVRGFSGHWMIFSIVPMAYFLTVHPKLEEFLEQQSEEENGPGKGNVT